MSYLKFGYFIYFIGFVGGGKIFLVWVFVKKRKCFVMLMYGNYEFNNKDLIGDFMGYMSKKVID